MANIKMLQWLYDQMIKDNLKGGEKKKMKIRVIDFLNIIANNKKHLPRYVVLLGKTYTDIYRIVQWNGYTYEFADGREFNLTCIGYLELNDEVYIPEEFINDKLIGYR